MKNRINYNIPEKYLKNKGTLKGFYYDKPLKENTFILYHMIHTSDDLDADIGVDIYTLYGNYENFTLYRDEGEVIHIRP